MLIVRIGKPLFTVMFAIVSFTACSSNGVEPNESPAFNPTQDISAAEPLPTDVNDTDTITPPSNENVEVPAGENPTSVSSVNVNQPLTCSASSEEFQTVFIALINQARSEPRQCGNTSHNAAPPIRWNAQLAEASERHSIDMSENDFFSHTGSDNSSVANRVDATEYQWSSVGENLAAGQNTVNAAIEGWLSSPGHCRNIMDTSYQETGIACRENQNTEFSTYWTNVFGTEFE